MNRVQGLQAIGLLFFAASVAYSQAGASHVRLEVGESRDSSFRTQVDGVRVTSADPSVATVRFDGYSRVTIAGVAPGTTTVTVSGEVVSYQTGIPERRPGRRVNALALQVRTPFTNTYTVEVVANPSQRTGVAPATDANGRHVRVRIGQTRRGSFDRQVVGVTVEGNDPAIARVQVRDDQVVITGVAPGTTRVTVRGSAVRYQTGIPAVQPGRRVNRIPLRVEEPFEETWTIEVYADPAREGRHAADHEAPAPPAVLRDPLEEGLEPVKGDLDEDLPSFEEESRREEGHRRGTMVLPPTDGRRMEFGFRFSERERDDRGCGEEAGRSERDSREGSFGFGFGFGR